MRSLPRRSCAAAIRPVSLLLDEPVPSIASSDSTRRSDDAEKCGQVLRRSQVTYWCYVGTSSLPDNREVEIIAMAAMAVLSWRVACTAMRSVAAVMLPTPLVARDLRGKRGASGSHGRRQSTVTGRQTRLAPWSRTASYHASISLTGSEGARASLRHYLDDEMLMSVANIPLKSLAGRQGMYPRCGPFRGNCLSASRLAERASHGALRPRQYDRDP